jgi:hypothetical protein
MNFTKISSYSAVALLFLFAPAVAQAEIFSVDKDLDAQGRASVSADIEVLGERANFFVDKDYRGKLPAPEILRLNSIVSNLSSEFSGNIYPKLRATFGEEQGGGKIAVLLHNMKPGVGGYARGGDKIYISIEEVLNSEIGPSYLAHEFQHLITYNQKTVLRGVEEEKWLNEARSEYAPTLSGYNGQWSRSYLKKRVSEFLDHPSDALLDWRGRSIDHASVSLFMHYLVDRYGTDILKSMMGATSVGAKSIDTALARLGRAERFSDVFRDWILAVYINSSVDNAQDMFKYKDVNLSFGNLHVLPTTTFRVYDNYSGGANFLIDNWSGQWHRFVPGSLGGETTLHIKISGVSSPASLSAPYLVSDFFGNTKVKFFDLGQGSTLSVPQFGNVVSSVVVVPIFSATGENNISSTGFYALEAFVSDSFVNRFSEGALVRAEGDSKVYIIKNGSKIGGVFKRWIQTEQVFGFYKHFTWNDIIEIKPTLLSSFSESFLIRKAGDYRVYEVDTFGRKTWLNITAAEFTASGRSWDAIYEVNEDEFNWYK